jgi:hypothetical protein
MIAIDSIDSESCSYTVWWCPTVPLAVLPIHAAGLYGIKEAFGSKLSDFVISSCARVDRPHPRVPKTIHRRRSEFLSLRSLSQRSPAQTTSLEP